MASDLKWRTGFGWGSVLLLLGSLCAAVLGAGALRWTGVVVAALSALYLVYRYRSAPWTDKPGGEAISRAMHAAQFEREEFRSSWLGVAMLQFPTDLMTYQRLIAEVEPDYVMETGTHRGALALYLATVLTAMNDHSKVITVGIDDDWRQTVKQHSFKKELLDRIVFIHGDSADRAIYGEIEPTVRGKKAIVILDSLHTKSHVLKELHVYSQLVSKGSYLLVNDTQLDSTEWVKGPGPMAAIREFVTGNADFMIDDSRQRYMISCLHSGILKRIG